MFGGKWEIDQYGAWESLAVKTKQACQIQIPVLVKGDYRLQFDFTVNNGNEWTSFIFPIGTKQVEIVYGSHNNNRAGLGDIDGKPHDANSTTQRHKGFSVGKSYPFHYFTFFYCLSWK